MKVYINHLGGGVGELWLGILLEIVHMQLYLLLCCVPRDKGVLSLYLNTFN